MSCPFCWPNRDNLDIVWDPQWLSIRVIRPLNPVTEGHVLVINLRHHSHDAAADPTAAADLMFVAAEYVEKEGIQANIITSVGPDATQTVFHTHVHVVPRRPNDGLALPWTGQKK